MACVFYPPAYGNRDIMQIQEDLEQERRDNEVEPDKKRMALEKIMKDYNKYYGSKNAVMEVDIYYQNI